MTRSLVESTLLPHRHRRVSTVTLGGSPGRGGQGQKQPCSWMGSAGALSSCPPVTVVGGGDPGAAQGLGEQARCVVMGDGKIG